MRIVDSTCDKNKICHYLTYFMTFFSYVYGIKYYHSNELKYTKMKSIRWTMLIAAISFVASIFTGCSTYSYNTAGIQSYYDNPSWAPPYYDGARYYYLPDIESYYDLSSNAFIYLNDGRWIYSQYIPSMYSDFDLNTCFAIVLDVNVYQPWMHHQYYISHYPRYYYRDYYDHSNIPYVRGFNENRKSAIYWDRDERDKARIWDNQNQNNSRKFKYTKEDRRQQKGSNYPYDDDPYILNGNNKNSNNSQNNDNFKDNNKSSNVQNDTQKGTSSTRTSGTTSQRTGTTSTKTGQTQNNDTNKSTRTSTNTSRQQTGTSTSTGTDRTHETNYYGKTIGNPVKVDKQMQDKSSIRSSGSTSTRSSSPTRSSGTSTNETTTRSTNQSSTKSSGDTSTKSSGSTSTRSSEETSKRR